MPGPSSLSYLLIIPHILSAAALLSLGIFSGRFRATLLGLALITSTAFLAVPSLNRPSELAVVPDSIEYAVIGSATLHGQPSSVTLEGTSHPSRYPYGFSTYFVAPAKLLFGDNHRGEEVLLSTTYIFLGLLAAFFLGLRLGGVPVAALSLATVTILPGYLPSASELLTYAPSAALGLILIVLLLEYFEQPKGHSLLFAGASSTLLLATAARPPSIFIMLGALGAVVISQKGSLLRPAILTLFCVSLPSILLVASYFLFNLKNFGELLRSGYSYWCSIPYDYFSKVLNLEHLPVSGAEALAAGAPLILFGVVSFLRKRSSNSELSQSVSTQLTLSAYLILFSIPLAVFHSLYFFPSKLFFLQATIVSAPLLALYIHSVISRAAPQHGRALSVLASVGAALVQALLVRATIPLGTPRGDTTREIIETTPAGSRVITGIDPVSFRYLEERYLADSSDAARRVPIPVSRRVEYADKVVTPLRPVYPPIEGSTSLIHSPSIPFPDNTVVGNHQAIQLTAVEAISDIVGVVSAGQQVYLELVFTSPEEQQRITRPFRVTKVTDKLVKLEAP